MIINYKEYNFNDQEFKMICDDIIKNNIFLNLAKKIETQSLYFEVMNTFTNIDLIQSTKLYVYNLSKDNLVYYVLDNNKLKMVFSENYSYYFLKNTGFTCRYGKNTTEDPTWCELGPEILDLEISVNGCPKVNGKNCKFCYKNNTDSKPFNMTLETFENIISKFPKNLSQIALGITGTQTNPDFINILKSCREKFGIIPNYTMSGVDLTDEIIDATIKYCGAVAISCYEGAKEVCYNTIKRIQDKKLGFHTNMHIVLSKGTFNHVMDVLNDVKNGNVPGLKSIVFLRIKPVGRASKLDTEIPTDMLEQIITLCEENHISFGFDSCSATNVIKYYRSKDRENMVQFCEPCESSKFSSYINVDGEYWHCSFCEKLLGYNGINVLYCDNFNTIWLGDEIESFRNPKIRVSESCQAFNLD